ncbi:MAG: enoyl-CoA hydratase [Actinobacteria bacterium]|uniref:Unannotated protein n=1 Tax=freshwater metagenome TaxID=449393 RepID=A0A6J7CLP3_9ZZZZ|nr:enoyl-CoA hydratase [Actinomycetota bacterium]
MSTTHDGVNIEVSAGVLRLALSRPDRMNAVNAGTLASMTEAVEAAAGDPEARVIVITGEGRAFCSGADLADEEGPTVRTLDEANRLVLALRRSPRPVLAAVNGAAAGVGCSLALAADIVVARESAYFLLAFARIGLMPDGGATALVTASIGRARAARMAMLAERITAPMALEWGLISAVAGDSDFDSTVSGMVDQLVAGPPLGFARTKLALDEAALTNLESVMAVERAGQAFLLESADFAEGVAAFGEKRPATFTGH